MRYIVSLRDKPEKSIMGGKGFAIAQLHQKGFLTPPGFILTPEAFTESLSSQNYRLYQQLFRDKTAKFSDIEELLNTLKLSERVQLELLQILADLFPYGGRFAVRSSAREEDDWSQSFAGQLETVLGVPLEDLGENIMQVWRSTFSQNVINYRQKQGFFPIALPPAVLIQQMIDSVVSGVAFGADPMTGRRNISVISSVYGLGTSLVSGESNADTFYLDRQGQIIQQQIIKKERQHQLKTELKPGISIAEVPRELAQKSSLNDEQIQEIFKLLRRCNQIFGSPQDIEWAIANDRLYILQSRPITVLPQTHQPKGTYNLWDNSNIAESYHGVTTPLTFSFARRAYKEVYRQFCLLLGVSAKTIAQKDRIFSNMLGFIQGRIYYNLLNWYRVLALLPGFRINRQFMGQMMGVKESLPEEIIQELQQGNWRDRLQDSWRILLTAIGLLKNYFLLPYKIRKFYKRLERNLEGTGQQLPNSADELVAYYRTIEQELLTHWDAPLINDFFTMIFYGVLRRLTVKWCGDEEGTMQNDLLAGQGNIISTEPARRMQKMAAIASQNEAFIQILCQGRLESILAAIETIPEFKSRYQNYLARFSDRCLEELKLESLTLADNPLPLLRAIGILAKSAPTSPPQPDTPNPNILKVRRALRSHPLRRLIFHWVLQNARKGVRDRENLRFERTRVFGRARQVFLALGKHFFIADFIEKTEDIFYLEVEEIMRMIEGTATCTNLKGLVALRKAEIEGYREGKIPSDRFETYGIPYLKGQPLERLFATASSADFQQGIGCSPGIVRGSVRVIQNPQEFLDRDHSSTLQPGMILVAERTDPGWILLFPAAAGLLVEQGSVLSHGAIVSRELGIPAIVSIPGVTQWLKDGDWVEFDGSTGKVYKIKN
ncbi:MULTISPECIES: PEP/pyruvate-binding domain-containing protein [Spirulina sp. CCY15215]|uniref:PEP/pyruvate-binding domain-containing protein n=1 Tax=Spirulina sp. CCY15215 TaxID=2767591 RepID=UPI00194E83E9|nr:PEP/pyruvate-binding domain-containing protein [Spirulina major]